MDKVDVSGFTSLFRILSRDRREHVGLLFGRGRRVTVYVPLRNASRENYLFTGDPWDTVVAFTSTDKYGLHLVGVFHTHPCGEPAPSYLDVEGMKRWPYIWVISSPYGLRAWRLVDDSLVEIGVRA